MDRWYEKAMTTWPKVLDETAAKFGNRTYIVFEGKQITFREFQEQVNSLAKAFLELGMGKDDRVGIWMTNCPEYLITQFAVYKIGATVVPLYSYFKKGELEYLLKQADVTTCVMKDSFLKGKINSLEIFRQICPEIDELTPDKFRSANLPNLRRVISLRGDETKGRYDWDQLLDKGSSSRLDAQLLQAQESINPFDVMNIAFTSGTTGFPKGGMSMHITNLCAFGHANARLSITENSVLIYQVPVFTNFGCWLTCAGVLEGCKLVLCGEPHFDPAQTLDLIEKEKVTHMVGAPTHYIDLSEHPDVDKYDLSSLEVAFLGGSDLSPEQNRRLSEKFGKYGVMSYGLSECGGFGTTTLSTDPPDLIYGMIGVPLPSARVKTVNPETGKRVIGEPGEIWLHDVYPGSCVGKGYYNMPDATKAAITDDGWFKTGDLAMELDNGYFVWKGRLKHAIRVGAMNVYPVEVENVLMTHPKVVEAVVVGIPDKRLGEVPMAWACTREEMTSEEVMEFARANLAAFKLPRYVKFYKLGELPVTGSGKYEKYKLQKMAIKELGLC